LVNRLGVRLGMIGRAIERAELAVDGADVGVVHIPVNQISDLITGNLQPSAHHGGVHQVVEIRGLVERDRVLDGQPLAIG